ncbi:MAG: FAD-dependent oxidoreductase [Lentisphaeria bacterium]|jgi:hypothetical protein
MKIKQQLQEPARDLPVMGEYDVVVVGGGIAGVAAALAASRAGSKVCLLEKVCALGGLATVGNVIVYLPLCDGNGRQVIGGIGEELLRLSVEGEPSVPEIGFEPIPACWERGGDLEERKKRRFRTGYNPITYLYKLERLLLKNRVTLFYDTRFCNVIKEGRHIRAVIVESKGGRTALLCKAVVDTSGEADVCVAAGEKTSSIGGNVRCGWYYYVDAKGQVRLRPLTDSGHMPSRRKPGVKYITFRGDSAAQVTAHVLASREMMMADMEAIKAKEGGNPYPIMIPTIPCFRMSRRLSGKVTLKPTDDHRWFDDSLGMTGDWRKAGPIFCLPLRSLAAVNTANLITAGRCMSSTGDTWDVTRVIPTCAVSGEAAGAAAAFLAREDNDIGFFDLDVSTLQKHLRRRRGIIDKSLLAQ